MSDQPKIQPEQIDLDKDREATEKGDGYADGVDQRESTTDADA
jgi:hypothetical protein